MRKVHFIGVGGIGMSGLADVLIARGESISGSDLRLNNLTDCLSEKGAVIYEGHSDSNIKEDVDLIVMSSCIRESNPEIIKAKDLGIPVITRGRLLKLVMEETPLSVAVTGTHGKTTTSGLIAHITESCGKEPTSVIGGELERIGGNAKSGKGDIIVAEVDESDGTFRDIGSTYGVVTNVEREHLENYGSMEDLLDAYKEFIGRISSKGIFFYNGEDPVLCQFAELVSVRKMDFGIGSEFKITCRDYSCAKSIVFDLYTEGIKRGTIKSPLIGRHNIMNLLAAIGVGLQLGIDFEHIAGAVESFKGVGRRFEKVGKVGTVEVIEDYAHHPTELAAVIRAAKDYGEGRVISVFQPHRHSRTNDLAREFIDCFNDSDVLVLTDVYSADEDPVKGIGIRDIYSKMDRGRFETLDFVEKKDIPGYVSNIIKENDVVLILGAGDIREISADVVQGIKESAGGKHAG